jgi:hypothetical protein
MQEFCALFKNTMFQNSNCFKLDDCVHCGVRISAMSKEFLSRRRCIKRLASFAAVFTLAGGLAACNETVSDFNPNAAPRARAPGVPVALVSLEGAPENVTSRLSVSIAKQATKRDILIVGIDGKPRYQIKGYVTLQAANEAGNSLVWTFDLFDAQRKRARRISGLETVSARSDDWNAVTDADLERVSFRAFDDIAEFLAATSGPLVSNAPQPRAAGLQASHY